VINADHKSFVRRVNELVSNAFETYYTGSVLVAHGERILLHRSHGWADSQHTRRIKPRTCFWIASISKQFTAAAILKLAESGRLSLDDPLTRFYPNVPVEKSAINLHQLLTHSAGLRQNYAADGITNRQEAVDAILAQPLKYAPNECFGYTNDAYNLLAALVEQVSGDTFESYLKKQILNPAGMRDTGFWGGDGNKIVAEIHGEVSEEVLQPNWGFRGAVGMYSTTGDLYRWYRALQSDLVLSAASRNQILSPHVRLDENETAGYGWFQTKGSQGFTTIWTRGTEDFGHNAILLTIPAEKVVITAASNAGKHAELAISRYLAVQLLQII